MFSSHSPSLTLEFSPLTLKGPLCPLDCRGRSRCEDTNRSFKGWPLLVVTFNVVLHQRTTREHMKCILTKEDSSGGGKITEILLGNSDDQIWVRGGNKLMEDVGLVSEEVRSGAAIITSYKFTVGHEYIEDGHQAGQSEHMGSVMGSGMFIMSTGRIDMICTGTPGDEPQEKNEQESVNNRAQKQTDTAQKEASKRRGPEKKRRIQ
ncbi:hypothetical protein PROFUN_15511 [Planoprotostelium fungivorum]|uniref:Uncharacterized protein n=1 Tax=Planoprotostelium fungivorum TaxID=1890364 RepID=A0A2P6N397_9EUKA|nr:hypothetical protein PROFUN_15511 [Planoprotostelium fungivorum]